VLGYIPLNKSLQDGVVVLVEKKNGFLLNTSISLITRHTQLGNAVYNIGMEQEKNGFYRIALMFKRSANPESNLIVSRLTFIITLFSYRDLQRSVRS
jgi:hypothetical protein